MRLKKILCIIMLTQMGATFAFFANIKNNETVIRFSGESELGLLTTNIDEFEPKLSQLNDTYVALRIVNNESVENSILPKEPLPFYFQNIINPPLRLKKQGVQEEITLPWEAMSSLFKDWKLIVNNLHNSRLIDLKIAKEYSFTNNNGESLEENTLSNNVQNNTPSGIREAVQSSNFNLVPNYPNTFSPTTTIGYSHIISDIVKVPVYNLIGQELAKIVNDNIKNMKPLCSV